MRVLLADPPAFTPWYDHELAAALGATGADVELATSRFRFGDLPRRDGYRRTRALLPAVVTALPALAAAAAAEGRRAPAGAARSRAPGPTSLHVQWLALPQVDVARPRSAAPSVFTAHDLLPRRTASERDLWRRLLGRFDRVVVHSERGRETLAELGVETRGVDPAPGVSERRRRARDDGRTLLSLGVIRPTRASPTPSR